MNYSSYELKYCERCGGLGLRRSDSVLPYCCDCEEILNALAPGQRGASRAAGQLRHIIHRLRQRVLAGSGEVLKVREAAHAS
jgi:hypothetical protein